jgi:hypothetical protein
MSEMTSNGKMFATLLFCCALAGCGGGGGYGGDDNGGGGVSISYSTSQVTFTAAGPWAPKPADQTITATLSGTAKGTLYIVVQVNNPELANVTGVTVTGPTTGQATVVPAVPASLGGGVRQGTITIRACLNDPSCNTGQIGGSPKTINVTYDVTSNVRGDTVSPRVVVAGKSGTVVLRGRGFTPGTTVAFGGTPATAVEVLGSSTIRATYPALAAGSYAVSLNSGALAFTGSLVAVPETGFAAEFIPHSVPTPAVVNSLTYDAERNALFVGTYANGTAPGKLLRYAYTGGAWASPSSVDMANLRQTRLSHDGSKLLALRGPSLLPPLSSMDEIDPLTLATLNSTPLNDGNTYAFSFALANDGNAIVATAPRGSGSTQPYLYSVPTRQFVPLPILASFNTLASGDGAFTQFLNSGYEYLPASGTIGTVSNNVDTSFGEPSSDLTGSKFQSGTGVFGANFAPFGYAPGNQTAAVINPAGTRLYTLDTAAIMHTYDLTQAPNAGDPFLSLVELGTGVALAGDPGSNSNPGPQMTITPDGKTVFIAGFQGIAIQPTLP